MKSVPLSQFMPYGAPELLGVSRRHMMQALMLSSALCVASFAAVGVVMMRMPHPILVVTPDIIPKKHVMEPPPRIEPARPHVAVQAKVPAIALPVPVPAIDPLLALVTDSGPRGVDTGGVVKDGEPDALTTPGYVESEPLPRPGDYVYFEELPRVTKKVDPEYSELALAMGVSGTVYAQLLVDTEGRVRDVRIDPKRSIPLLNESVIAAARQWMFKPALANGHPVAVWVAVPFKFVH